MFWTWAFIELNEANFNERTQSQRFQNISQFSLLGVGDEKLTSFYSELLSHKSLFGFLDICQRNVSGLSTDILCQLLTRINWVFLKKVTLSEDQVTQIVSRLAGSEQLELDSLYFVETDLSAVAAESLSRLAVRLTRLELYEAGLSSEQTVALFTTFLSSSDCKLEYLELSYNDLSAVPPDLLASAVLKIREVKISNCQLTRIQVSAMFSSIAESPDLKLSVLEVFGNNLSAVSPAIISSGNSSNTFPHKICVL